MSAVKPTYVQVLAEEWQKMKDTLRTMKMGWSEVSFNWSGSPIESYGFALEEPTQEQLVVTARVFAWLPFALMARKKEGELFPGLGTPMMWFNRDSPSTEHFEREGKTIVSFYLRGGWLRQGTGQ